MRRVFLIATACSTLVLAGTALWVLAGWRGTTCAGDTDASAPVPDGRGTASAAAPSGRLLGRFDLTMAGCRFACATREDHEPSAVMPQPAALEGRLTQCPVSGVVFTVDGQRPQVRIGEDDYVTCCEDCAVKLRAEPGRFVRS